MAANTNKFPAKLARAQAALQLWYRTFGRHHLPWRNTSDPYRVYISEVMLQQTQVKTVLERYYEPFLKRFPTLAALAAAPREAVMKAWEGLGYYTRAANLHAAAQAAMPALPATVEELLALPGIGHNTAHAVASFGFGAAVPVMEANVKRVLCRVFALKTPDAATLWDKARFLLDEAHAFDHNQAMMDIGAMICTKRNPRCGQCPLAIICRGKAKPEFYPEPVVRKIPPIRRRIIVAWHDGQGRYILQRRTSRFLGGLYGFPEQQEGTQAVIWDGRRYPLEPGSLIGNIMQKYSHFTLEAAIHRIVLKAIPMVRDGLAMASLKEMELLALSGSDHKILQLLARAEARTPPVREISVDLASPG